MATEDSSEIVREQSESVAATNLKVLGDGPAFYQNQGYANATTFQQGMNNLFVSVVGKTVELVVETAPAHAGGHVAALQQLLKGAQTTPPVTG